MDFSRVELSAEDRAFRDELRAFLKDIVTDDVIQHDRETGENFHEGLHLALGELGYLAKDFKDESDGGFSAGAAHASGTSRSAARTRRGSTGADHHDGREGLVKFADPTSWRDAGADAVRAHPAMSGLHRARRRLGRGDVQDAAVRDGDGSLDHQRLQDVHLERPQRPVRLPDHQHRPRDAQTQEPDDVPGSVGHARRRGPGIRTVDGDRTNITYYSDVRVDDKYRIGEVNGGWTVLREALNSEHGTVERDADGTAEARHDDRAHPADGRGGRQGRCR